MTNRRPAAILLSAEQIQKRVAEVAAAIRRDVPGDVHLVGVLTGAFVFLADLMRVMDGRLSVDFVAVSSYGSGTTNSGDIRLIKDVGASLEGKDVVIVEDIVDTGDTLVLLQQMLRARHPRTLRTACLLSKTARRRVSVPVDYVGFTIDDDDFVVGYGLDYAEQYRHLPHIAILGA